MYKFISQNRGQIIFILSVFAVVSLVFRTNLYLFQTNLLQNLKAEPYNGMVLPFKMSPDWVGLSADQWKLSYENIPSNKLISAPAYNPAELALSSKSLNLATSEGKRIRNAQVTYSVPYMGNYLLDGHENTGSHLAVDIKLPVNTPIYAIGNGVVIKSAIQSSGFGVHVCLRHDDFPSFDSNGTKTYISCYAHLNSSSVNEGSVVSKGDLIGLSGNTGTATTPHLHFQIDQDTVPWHPYWPFTSKEASDAGMSFFDAINNGLNQDKALAATINPLIYIQNNSGNATVSVVNPVPVVSNPISEEPANEVVEVITPPTITPVNTGESESEPETNVSQTFSAFELEYTKGFTLNQENEVLVKAMDENGDLISGFVINGEASIRVDSGSVELQKTFLNSFDFKGGIASFVFIPKAEFGVKLTVLYQGKEYSTKVLQSSIFSDVDENNDNFVAISFLKNNQVIRGYADGTFKPDQKVTRVEALKFIFEGLNKEVATNVYLRFKDTDSKSWYARYVAAAQKAGIVEGYAGNVFKPSNSVTRAEFLKMLIASAGYDLTNMKIDNDPYQDVSADSWYARYVYFAKQKKLISDSSNFALPNAELTRAEIAEILYRMIVLKLTDSKEFNSSLALDENKIAEHFKF